MNKKLILCVILISMLLGSLCYGESGPSLKVYVYAKSGLKLHGAQAKISDNWEYQPASGTVYEQTNSRGVAIFSNRNFKNWRIYGRDQWIYKYYGDDPWDWVAVPLEMITTHSESEGTQHTITSAIRAKFKVKVEVSIEGWESQTKEIVFDRPGAEVTFYLVPSRPTDSEESIQVHSESNIRRKIPEGFVLVEAGNFRMGSTANGFFAKFF